VRADVSPRSSACGVDAAGHDHELQRGWSAPPHTQQRRARVVRPDSALNPSGTGLTSRIDAFGADGFRLTNYCPESQCTPTRSALLTGRHAIRTGTHTVPLGAPGGWGLVAWEKTLGDLLGEAGYACAAYGSSEPDDRVIDGVNQLDWLTAKADSSQREGYIYWMGPRDLRGEVAQLQARAHRTEVLPGRPGEALVPMDHQPDDGSSGTSPSAEEYAAGRMESTGRRAYGPPDERGGSAPPGCAPARRGPRARAGRAGRAGAAGRGRTGAPPLA
jgi:Sulfatase